MSEPADPLEPYLVDGNPADDTVPCLYVASPLTGLKNERKDIVSFRLAQVKNAIIDATLNVHSQDDQWPVAMHVPWDHTPPWNDAGLSPQTIYERNLDQLLNSDGLVVVTDETCSAGVGQEIEWAVRSGIPILYLSSTDVVSRQIRGIPHAIDVRVCPDPETMSANVRNWLLTQRGPLQRGPSRRADRTLAYAKVTAQLEAAWASTKNPSAVAMQLGTRAEAIWIMVRSPARVALTPWWTVCELSAALGVSLDARRPLTYAESRAWMKAADENGWDSKLAEQVRTYALATQVTDLELPGSWKSAKEHMPGFGLAGAPPVA